MRVYHLKNGISHYIILQKPIAKIINSYKRTYWRHGNVSKEVMNNHFSNV
jgi:hypothetical protein